jgi:hypothetical protein
MESLSIVQTARITYMMNFGAARPFRHREVHPPRDPRSDRGKWEASGGGHLGCRGRARNVRFFGPCDAE